MLQRSNQGSFQGYFWKEGHGNEGLIFLLLPAVLEDRSKPLQKLIAFVVRLICSAVLFEVPIESPICLFRRTLQN